MSGRLTINSTSFQSNPSLTSQYFKPASSRSDTSNPRPSLDAAFIGIRGAKTEDAAVVYDRFAKKPRSSASDSASSKPVLPRPRVDATDAAQPSQNVAKDASKVYEGLYRAEKDGSTTVAFDGIYLSIKKDGSVDGTILSPDGERLSGKGSFKDGKIQVSFDKIGTYSGDLAFAEGGGGKVADGRVFLSNVQPVSNTPSKPVPVDAAKPAPSDVADVNKVIKGLYRKEADGSTTVAFDGIYLSIKKDGTVEGQILGPDGQRLKGKGSFKDGKIQVTFDKIGTYSADLKFTEGGGGKVADGQVILSNAQPVNSDQVKPTPAPVPPAKPAPAEGPSVKGVQVGNTAYFGGFSLSFGKDGKVGVSLNSPDGRKIEGSGTINDKGEIQVTFRDPKGVFEGLTYSGVFSRSEDKDGGSVQLSNIQFLGRKTLDSDHDVENAGR